MWFLMRNTDNQGYKVSSELYYKRRRKQNPNPNPSWNNPDEKANPKVTNKLFYALARLHTLTLIKIESASYYLRI